MPLPSRRRDGRRQRRRPRLHARRLRRRAARPAHRRRAGRADRRSSATTWSTTRGTRSSPAGWPRPTSSRSSRASATSATSPCGRRSRSACAASAACSTATPYAAFQTAHRRPRRARSSPTSAGQPADGEGDLTVEAARAAGRRARRARQRRRRPGALPRRCSTDDADRSRSSPPPPPAPSPPSARDADYDEFLATVPHRDHAAGASCRYLYALAEFPEPRRRSRARSSWRCRGEVKTQDAPFLLNRCIANRHHGADRRGSFVRRHWPELHERFPDNTIVRMVDSVKMLTTPERRRRRAGLLRRAPDPAGGQDAGADCSSASGSTPPCEPAKPNHWRAAAGRAPTARPSFSTSSSSAA